MTSPSFVHAGVECVYKAVPWDDIPPKHRQYMEGDKSRGVRLR